MGLHPDDGRNIVRVSWKKQSGTCFSSLKSTGSVMIKMCPKDGEMIGECIILEDHSCGGLSVGERILIDPISPNNAIPLIFMIGVLGVKNTDGNSRILGFGNNGFPEMNSSTCTDEVKDEPGMIMKMERTKSLRVIGQNRFVIS